MPNPQKRIIFHFMGEALDFGVSPMTDRDFNRLVQQPCDLAEVVLREHRHTDRRVTITLRGGDRLLAKARPVGAGQYILVSYVGDLPFAEARKKSPVTGTVDAKRLVIAPPNAADKMRRRMRALYRYHSRRSSAPQ